MIAVLALLRSQEIILFEMLPMNQRILFDKAFVTQGFLLSIIIIGVYKKEINIVQVIKDLWQKLLPKISFPCEQLLYQTKICSKKRII